jgi:hypothetical protein
MRNSALVLAVTLAACFTLTSAEAAKKKQAKPPADAAYEWNVKNVKMVTPNFAAPFAQPAQPAKMAKKGKKKKAKKA